MYVSIPFYWKLRTVKLWQWIQDFFSKNGRKNNNNIIFTLIILYPVIWCARTALVKLQYLIIYCKILVYVMCPNSKKQ